MSYQDLTDYGSASSQESSDYEAESQNNSQIHDKSQQMDKHSRSWKFNCTIQADALDGEFDWRKQPVLLPNSNNT